MNTTRKQKLLNQIKSEMRNSIETRNKSFKSFVKNIMKPINPNDPDTYYYKPYENKIILYLYDLYKEMENQNSPLFLNKKFHNFQEKRNTMNMRERNKEKIISILGKLRLTNRKIQTTNTNISNRTRKVVRTNFSNADSMSSTNSLPSLQSLRNNTANFEENTKQRYTPKRRLQGKVINPNTQSQATK